MVSRRDFLKGGCGISAILAAGECPAYIKSLMAALQTNLILDRSGPYTAKDYIQSGLVAMWDGIENVGWGEHNPEPTEWLSLIDPLDSFAFADINKFYTPVYSVEEDHLHIGTIAQWVAKRNATYSGFSRGTFEVVMAFHGVDDTYTSNSVQIAKGYSTTYPGVRLIKGTASGSERWIVGRNYARQIDHIDFNEYIGKKCTISLQARNSLSTSNVPNYINGREASLITLDNQVEGWGYSGWEKASIGNYTTSIAKTGCAINTDLYCIRIYNRDLSANEIAHNYKVDRERFVL